MNSQPAYLVDEQTLIVNWQGRSLELNMQYPDMREISWLRFKLEFAVSQFALTVFYCNLKKNEKQLKNASWTCLRCSCLINTVVCCAMATASGSLTLNPSRSLLIVGRKRSFHGSFPPIFQASYRPLISPGTPIARPPVN